MHCRASHDRREMPTRTKRSPEMSKSKVELRAILDAAGVTYPPSATRSDLADLVAGLPDSAAGRRFDQDSIGAAPTPLIRRLAAKRAAAG